MAKIALVVSDLTSPAAVEGAPVTSYRIRSNGFDATEAQVVALRKTLAKIGLSEDLVTVFGADEVKPAGSAAGDAKAIREWAAENGIEVSARGRISDELREAFYEAQDGTDDADEDEDREPTDEELDALV